MSETARVSPDQAPVARGLVFKDEPLRYGRAIDPEAVEAIFRLRYRCYRLEETIDANPAERFADQRDEDPNVFIFGIGPQDQLAASIRIHVCSPDMPFAPGLDVFPEVLGAMLERGESFVDPTRFVVDRTVRRSMSQFPFATVRLAGMAAEHFGADHMLATVRAEHVPFYRRYFDMDILTEPRHYPSLKRPICLMSGHFQTMRRTVYPRHPYFLSTLRERVGLFGPSRMIALGMTQMPVKAANDDPAEGRALASV